MSTNSPPSHDAPQPTPLRPRPLRGLRRSAKGTLRVLVRHLAPAGSGRRRWCERRVLGPLRRRLEAIARVTRRDSPLARRERRAHQAARSAWHRGPWAGAGRPGRRLRLLYVLHEAPGGVRATSLDLMSRIHGPAGDGLYECFALSATPYRLRLLRFDAAAGAAAEIDSWHPSQSWSNARRRDAERREFYSRLLRRLEIDLVHVRHLLGHTFDLVDLCAQRSVPVVLSIHDFYLACPGIYLIDDRGRYCGAQCTATEGQCFLPVPWLEDLPRLKGSYLAGWRADVADILGSVAALVTTSEHARRLMLKTYPQIRERDVRVIEHGRGLEGHTSMATPPHPSEGPVRLLLPGDLGPHKGSETVRRLAALDVARGGRLELHFIGRPDPSLHPLGVHHGPYQRQELAAHVSAIRPSFIGLLSIAAETYSHLLSEAWSVGVPVIASDRGALRERVARHGGGWLVPPEDPEAIHRKIFEVVGDPGEYERQRRRCSLEGIRTMEEMAADYVHLYCELCETPRASRRCGAAAPERAAAGTTGASPRTRCPSSRPRPSP